MNNFRKGIMHKKDKRQGKDIRTLYRMVHQVLDA